MGILNVTPDSFSDGNRYANVDAALARAKVIAAQGATIIDVGGESTRPGAAAVDEAVEIARVVPVIEGIDTAPTSDQLKHFGAAMASFGSIAIFFIRLRAVRPMSLRSNLAASSPIRVLC